MHPAWLRRSSVKYSRSSPSSTPCHPGVSTLSVRNNFWRGTLMLIGRVVRTVVATQKNEQLEGEKLLLVQPVDLENRDSGDAIVAFDVFDAGIGDRVLLVQEGKSAQAVLRKGVAAVDAAILGVIDHVYLES